MPDQNSYELATYGAATYGLLAPVVVYAGYKPVEDWRGFTDPAGVQHDDWPLPALIRRP